MKKLLTSVAVLTALTAQATIWGSPTGQNVAAQGLPPVAQQAKLPTPESGNYSQFCTEKWTKRGALDIQMFNYCMGRQAEGDRTLADLAAKHSSLPWMQQVIDAAIQKWSKRGMRDEVMVAYEVSRQIDAYLDIVYASKQSGFHTNALTQCSAKWQQRESPDWTMTLYCYKRATGTD
jgi:hypothetical protein